MSGLWPQAVNALLGLWLMAAPEVLDYGDPAASNHHVVGPLIVSFATVALWEATRGVGRLNLLLGMWLVISPWALGDQGGGLVNGTVVGVVVALLAVLSRREGGRYGGGWSALFSSRDPGA